MQFDLIRLSSRVAIGPAALICFDNHEYKFRPCMSAKRAGGVYTVSYTTRLLRCCTSRLPVTPLIFVVATPYREQ